MVGKGSLTPLSSQEEGSAAGAEVGTSPHSFSRYRALRRDSKFTKKTKNRQNQARKHSVETESQNQAQENDNAQSENLNQAREHDYTEAENPNQARDYCCLQAGSQAGDGTALHPRLQLAAIEVDVEINAAQKDSVNQVIVTPPEASPFKANGRRKSTPRKKRKQNSAEALGSADNPPGHQGSVLVNAPSEVSIISAAAVEELCDLRNYYSKQLQRINYISHEHLQDSDSGILTCSRGPMKSLRLPWGSSITRTVRNLWTRVSTRRKLIRR
ncbi:uncharacterized protein LOC118770657 [Megalops cyprinoides]|uniref:uncharacterized protein LOC118770657 n=1 Tax=Megalops cyprinoides TaxID=118141 RepID=UPI001864BD63|nr:uncharacterized protein LOC118770657 [Megalops cyprinoides]